MSAKKTTPDTLCARCRRNPVSVEHHILPRALGGSGHRSNKQWLCRVCHAFLHPYLRYPKGKRIGKPFFLNEIGTYYGKDKTIHEKAKYLATIDKLRAQNHSSQGFRKIGR